MAITFEIQPQGSRLMVTATGYDEDAEEVLNYGKSVLQAAIENGCSQVLCDESALEYRIDTVDIYDLANKAVSLAKALRKIAIVCRPEDYEDGMFYENVAVNRGLHVKIFKDLAEARQWLDE